MALAIKRNKILDKRKKQEHQRLKEEKKLRKKEAKMNAAAGSNGIEVFIIR